MTERLQERLRAAVAARNASRPRKLLVPGLARYATRAVARFSGAPRRTPAQLFFGGEMDVVLPDCVSEAIYLFGYFDDVTTRLALEAVRPGDTVLDVGAHVGYFSLLASALAGESGHVYAFEPTASTFDVLAANARRQPNITAIRAAAGDQPGERDMMAYDIRFVAFNTLSGTDRLPAGTVASWTRVRVPLVRLDDFAHEWGVVPDVIKIDVENFEDRVIEGLLETLTAHHPRVILEMGGEPAMSASNRLLAFGYVPFGCSSLQTVEPWTGSIEEANARRQDLLFQFQR